MQLVAKREDVRGLSDVVERLQGAEVMRVIGVEVRAVHVDDEDVVLVADRTLPYPSPGSIVSRRQYLRHCPRKPPNKSAVKWVHVSA